MASVLFYNDVDWRPLQKRFEAGALRRVVPAQEDEWGALFGDVWVRADREVGMVDSFTIVGSG